MGFGKGWSRYSLTFRISSCAEDQGNIGCNMLNEMIHITSIIVYNNKLASTRGQPQRWARQMKEIASGSGMMSVFNYLVKYSLIRRVYISEENVGT